MLLLGAMKNAVVLDKTPNKFVTKLLTFRRNVPSFQFHPTFYCEDAVSKFLRMVADFLPEYEVSNINLGSNSNVSCLLSFIQRRTANVAVVDSRLVFLWHALDLCSVYI